MEEMICLRMRPLKKQALLMDGERKSPDDSERLDPAMPEVSHLLDISVTEDSKFLFLSLFFFPPVAS